MRILALDTTTSACSVALWDDGRVRVRRFRMMARGHAEALMPMVVDALETARVEPEALDLIAVTIGPGAFTGVRIGLAAARGLALATRRPCFGVTTFEAILHAVPARERTVESIAIVLETKRGDVYVQVFACDGSPIGDPAASSTRDVPGRVPPGPVLLVGDAARRIVDVLRSAGLEVRESKAPGLPDAASVAAIAADRWRPECSLPPPSPLYLGTVAATVPAAEESGTEGRDS